MISKRLKYHTKFSSRERKSANVLRDCIVVLCSGRFEVLQIENFQESYTELDPTIR